MHAALSFVERGDASTTLMVPFGLLCLRAIVRDKQDIRFAFRILEAFAARQVLHALDEGLGLLTGKEYLRYWITLWDISPTGLAAVARLQPETIKAALPIVLGLELENRVSSWGFGLGSISEYIRAGSVTVALQLVPYLDWANEVVAAMYRRQKFVVVFGEDGEDEQREPSPCFEIPRVRAVAECYDLLKREDGRLRLVIH